MSFAYPWVLICLAFPIVLTFLGRRGRARAGRVRMPFDHAAPRRQRLVRLALASAQAGPPLMLVFGIVMIAIPQRLQPPVMQRKLTNIQIVLDVSGSMATETPTRYSYAREAIERFTRAREGDAMGLIIFGTKSIRLIPITEDLEAIRLAMPLADPKYQPPHMRGTAIGGALRFAAKAMQADAKSEGDRVVILVSDGVSGDIRGEKHLEVAGELIDAGAKVFYLHIGSGAHDPGAMQIASLTGGRGFVAGDAASTLAVFRALDQMTRTEFLTEQPEPLEFYRPFAWLALAASAMHTVGLLGLRYTPW